MQPNAVSEALQAEGPRPRGRSRPPPCWPQALQAPAPLASGLGLRPCTPLPRWIRPCKPLAGLRPCRFGSSAQDSRGSVVAVIPESVLWLWRCCERFVCSLWWGPWRRARSVSQSRRLTRWRTGSARAAARPRRTTKVTTWTRARSAAPAHCAGRAQLGTPTGAACAREAPRMTGEAICRQRCLPRS